MYQAVQTVWESRKYSVFRGIPGGDLKLSLKKNPKREVPSNNRNVNSFKDLFRNYTLLIVTFQIEILWDDLDSRK